MHTPTHTYERAQRRDVARATSKKDGDSLQRIRIENRMVVVAYAMLEAR